MTIKQKVLLSAFAALLSGAMIAHAADEKTAPEKSAAATEKSDPAKPAKKKVKRHSHAVEKGVMPPDTAPAAKEGEMGGGGMMHDHTKDRH